MIQKTISQCERLAAYKRTVKEALFVKSVFADPGDAKLQGMAAAQRGYGKHRNPYTQYTERAVAWNEGHDRVMNAK